MMANRQQNFKVTLPVNRRYKMFTNNLHNFSRGAAINRVQEPLTMDALRVIVPSAFATSAHESRSNRYAYIPTANVIEAMMREGFQPFKATQSRSRIEGKTEFTKHMIRFRHSSIDTALTVGDSIPEVVLINSHDGTSAYKLIAGMYRLVCSNGLMVAESTTGSLSVHHTGDIVNRVIEGSFEIVGQSQKALEVSRQWEALQLTAGEREAFAEAAHTVRFADAEGKIDTPITAAMLLNPRRHEDANNSLWGTFNRVQENAIKGGLRRRAERRPGERMGRMVTTREVKGIDQDVKLNRALWQLAERMAELKGVQAA
jgi:hypothetical protein